MIKRWWDFSCKSHVAKRVGFIYLSLPGIFMSFPDDKEVITPNADMATMRIREIDDEWENQIPGNWLYTVKQ